jgi:thiamine biosynthesis lipoprotein
VEALQLAGVAAGCVNAGGDLRAFGPQPFLVGVRDPRDPSQLAMRLELTDEALATSAPYFSLKDHDTAATSALCNGLLGEAIVDTVSASVRSPLCVTADALTKVVLATRNTAHPALAAYGATSFLI